MTTTADALNRARALLAPWTAAAEEPEVGRLDLRIAAADLSAAVAVLAQHDWGYLAAITGLASATGGPEVLYHFCAGAAVLTVRVQTAEMAPSVPSLCAWIPGALCLERELHEMFGVTVEEIPDDSRLYLPDDWPEGVYPLRKGVCEGAPG